MHQPRKRMEPYALQDGEGWKYHYDIDFTVKAGELEGGSGSAFLEYTTHKGEEPPPHIHLTEDEMFYVLEGTLSFRCNGKTFDLSKGGFIFMPHSVEHSYTIHNEEPVRLIVVTAPMREGIQGGWGGFVSDMGKKDQ